MKIFQIESTNECNAACHYCPHPKMTREQGQMDTVTFKAAIARMTNRYVGLHHFGEPFLNKRLSLFIEMLHIIGVKCEFSTNGIITDLDMIQLVMVSEPHIMRIAYDWCQPDEFIRRVLTFNKSTIVKLHSVDGLLEKQKPYNNFAGSVSGESEISGECYFKKYGYVCVLWNGDIVPCCQDYDGKEVIGSVFDKEEPKLKETYSICKNCTGMQFAEDGLWEKE